MITRIFEGLIWEVVSPSEYKFDAFTAKFDGKDWKFLKNKFKNMKGVAKYLVRELEGPTEAKRRSIMYGDGDLVSSVLNPRKDPSLWETNGSAKTPDCYGNPQIHKKEEEGEPPSSD